MSRAKSIERLFENSRILQKVWKDFFHQILKDEKLSLPQLEVLFILRAHGTMTGSEMATSVRVSRSAVTQLLDGLRQHGCINREDDAHDGRVTHLSLSPPGMAIIERIDAKRLEQLKYLTAGLTDEQVNAMAVIQDSMIARAENQDKEKA